MAYPLNSGDIVLVQVWYAEAEITSYMNTFHYRVLTPASTPDGGAALLVLAQRVGNVGQVGTWAQAWQTFASTLVTLDKVVAQKIHPIRYMASIYDTNSAGMAIGDPEPAVLQASITRRGEAAGKGFTGGLRVSGIPEQNTTFGSLSAQKKDELQVMANVCKTNILTTAPTVEYEPIIFRRASPTASPKVTVATAHATLRTQRTRIAGRGI